MKIKHFPIIVNPASGKPEPILSTLNEVFKNSDIKWDVFIAKKAGDTLRLVKELVEKKEHVIGVYGGDGTVTEAVGGLINTSIPLAIFPGGTANVMATDLGIPADLQEACEMLKKGRYKLRSVDVGRFNKRYFILRICQGFEADMVKGADRETKNKWGRFAYFFSAVKAVKKMKLTRYEISIDGEKHSVEGLTSIVANSGSAGYGDLKLAGQIDVSDGMLDVLIIKQFNAGLLKYIGRVILKGNPAQDRELVGHWQGKEIEVTAKPQQDVVCDGEVLEKMTIKAKILPGAVTILTPDQKSPKPL